MQSSFNKEREMRAGEAGRRLGADGKVLVGESGIVAAARNAAEARAAEGREAEEEDEGEDEAKGVKGMARKLWMGQEKEGWQARRMREEREKLAEGKSYLDLITDQIWEVWTQGESKEGKDGDDKEEREGGKT